VLDVMLLLGAGGLVLALVGLVAPFYLRRSARRARDAWRAYDDAAERDRLTRRS
jgi:hypothetical protein